jgi:hypothetical protein
MPNRQQNFCIHTSTSTTYYNKKQGQGKEFRQMKTVIFSFFSLWYGDTEADMQTSCQDGHAVTAADTPAKLYILHHNAKQFPHPCQTPKRGYLNNTVPLMGQ